MARWMKVLACALIVAALAPAASAQEISGVVVRVDQPARVIVLEEGRMFRLTGDNVVFVDNQPVMLDTLQPGSPVVIRSAEPVMLQDGVYVVVAEPAPVVSEPTALPRSTVVTTTPRVITQPKVSGVVSRVDAAQGIVVFEDGRIVQTGPKTIAIVDGRPVELVTIVPGTRVVLTAINPVVYRNGRYALMNEGFRDDSGSVLAPDADFAGYEADVDDAGMQVQGS
jgi:hypothetical protein